MGRLGDLGHTRGQYVAFGKTAAQDATARMTRGGLLPLDGGLDSSTADSCARKCLREAVDLVHEPMEDTDRSILLTLPDAACAGEEILTGAVFERVENIRPPYRPEDGRC